MQYQFGKTIIYLLDAGEFWLDGGTMFGIVPRVLWEKFLKPDEENRIPISLNCFLVANEDRRVLLEAGIGNWWDLKMKDIYKIKTNSFDKILANIEFSKEDITDIFVSHLHFDHIGGAVERLYDQLVPTFPKAKIHIQKKEYEHALSPTLREKSSYKKEILIPLSEAGCFNIIDGDREIFPNFYAKYIGAHSLGMQILKIKAEEEVLYFLGDLVPTTAHLKINWITSFDLEPLKILKIKEELLSKGLDEKAIFLLYHEKNIPIGRLKKDMEGNYFLERIRQTKYV